MLYIISFIYLYNKSCGWPQIPPVILLWGLFYCGLHGIHLCYLFVAHSYFLLIIICHISPSNQKLSLTIKCDIKNKSQHQAVVFIYALWAWYSYMPSCWRHMSSLFPFLRRANPTAHVCSRQQATARTSLTALFWLIPGDWNLFVSSGGLSNTFLAQGRAYSACVLFSHRIHGDSFTQRWKKKRMLLPLIPPLPLNIRLLKHVML